MSGLSTLDLRNNKSNMNKCILFVANTSWYLCNFRLSLIRRMKEYGWQVIAVAPSDKYSTCIERNGISYIPLKLSRKGTNPFDDLFLFFRLYKVYRTHSPSIVHHFTIKPIIYGSIAAKFAKVPAVVNSITGLGYIFCSKELRARILRSFVKCAYSLVLKGSNKRIIFQNQDDMDIFISAGIIKPQGAVMIRGSGVDINRFIPSEEPEGTPVILLCARMLWDKGVGDLVEAAKLLRHWNVPALVVLAGQPDPGNPMSIPERQLYAWEREGIIKWLGYVDDIENVFIRANIVALPTTYGEGVPRSLIEAAASGRPIVATNIPGCREIVHHGKNGFLVEVQDIKGLAIALKTLIEKPDLRTRMGKYGRELVISNFSSEQIVKETIKVYKELFTL